MLIGLTLHVTIGDLASWLLENDVHLLAVACVLGTACAAVSALMVRRYAARKVDARFCPQCGHDLLSRERRLRALPTARPVRTAQVTTRAAPPRSTASALLKSGWSRSARFATDAHGEPVTANDPQACCFTIWSAAHRAYGHDGRLVQAYFLHLRGVLEAWYGSVNMNMYEWHRDPARTHSEVVAVAEEIERRMARGG